MTTTFAYEPFYDLERIFDVLSGQTDRNGCQTAQRNKAAGAEATRVLRPRMNLHEDQENNLVTATFEFPGVSKEDIQIDVQNNKLTVSTELKQTSEADEKGYVVRERRFGKFTRVVQLPEGIKDEEIKATMENGLLTVTFPRSTPELAPKRVTIS